MKTIRLILALILVSGFTANVFAGLSVTMSGKPEPQYLRWKGRVIKIAISTSLGKTNPGIKVDSDVAGAIRRSLQAWENAADIEFQIEPSDKQSVSPAGVSGDGVSLITIASTPENVLFFAKDSQTVSAKTRLFYNRKGFITEADVVLNPFQQFSTDGSFATFDLESALTHEIGHLLGLRHSGVMGAAMAENLAKNAAPGPDAFEPRGLADTDISSIRELYGGVDKDNSECCATVAGRVTLQTGRGLKNLKIWAEESDSGRVVGQADTGSEGAFRIGGIPAGIYKLFWKTKAGQPISSSGELGSIEAGNLSTTTLNQKIALEQTKLNVNYVGVDGQLADSSVRIERGHLKTIYIGGKNLDPKNVTVETGSAFLHVDADSLTAHDFGEDVSVLSFVVTVDPNAPSGIYSIFVVDSNGRRSPLIGVLKVL
ncbi:MAG: matrixin family metalloprotease [Pyrinomonadaceae bacterium]